MTLQLGQWSDLTLNRSWASTVCHKGASAPSADIALMLWPKWLVLVGIIWNPRRMRLTQHVFPQRAPVSGSVSTRQALCQSCQRVSGSSNTHPPMLTLPHCSCTASYWQCGHRLVRLLLKQTYGQASMVTRALMTLGSGQTLPSISPGRVQSATREPAHHQQTLPYCPHVMAKMSSELTGVGYETGAGSRYSTDA